MALLTHRRSAPVAAVPAVPAPAWPAGPTVPIASVTWRSRARIAGRIRSVRIRPWADVPSLECTVLDDTGGITVVFLGRREIAGIRPGALMAVEGIAGDHHGRLAMLNPDYDLAPVDGPVGAGAGAH